MRFPSIFHALMLATSTAVAQGQPQPAAPPSMALGDLLVAPTRVVFEGRKRTEELTLVNTGNVAATYRISFVQMRMKVDGTLEEVLLKEKDGRYADELVRYSPRQVLLQPGESQIVRLQVRKPELLTDGEYRSHLVFRAVPPPPPVTPQETSVQSGLSIRLTPIYGVSIPIIIRHGTTKVTCAISDIKLQDDGKSLSFNLERKGNQSIYGNIKVSFSAGPGKSELLGEMRGVAVYDGVASRPCRVPLVPRKDQAPLSPGKFDVVFETTDQPPLPLARAEMVIP